MGDLEPFDPSFDFASDSFTPFCALAVENDLKFPNILLKFCVIMPEDQATP
jgi:hypothetical protein